MNRNDYRRAFIMLRSAVPGYGGHVRLEKRTLSGNMYFIVTAPEGSGPLRAALAGQRNGQYYAAPIGELARDRRGQLALAWPFDPRRIDGRPLEAYAWVAVANAGGESCAVVLTGNVEGSREVDPAALERAVCALFAGNAPAADLPGPDEVPLPSPPVEGAAPAGPDESALSADAPDPVEGTASAGPDEPALSADAPDPVDAPGRAAPAESADGDVKIYTRSRPSAVSADAQACPSPAEEAPARAPASPADAAPESSAPEYVGPQTAANVLGLDIAEAWIEPAEPLRRLFATQAPVDAPFPDGLTYVAAAMPAGSGLGDCLIGLRAADGRITGIRYAVPGAYAPEPPAGLEDYRWDAAGYWTLDIGVS